MDFDQYQKESRKTAIYPNAGNNYIYPTLGLGSEVGEVLGKIKKVERDKGGIIDEEIRKWVRSELGDVLWYVSQVATELGLSLDEIGKYNIEKLSSRKERGTLNGDGDNR